MKPTLARAPETNAASSAGTLTDDTLPNPWDTLPAYFSSLLAELE